MWFQYACPTSCTMQHCWLWQKKPVKFIFLEKPAVTTAAEADVVRTLYGELPIRVQVNYTRRFVPEIRSIREAIRSGNYGTFLTGTGYYGKGLLHNGSHMVDLLQFLVGEVGEVAKVSEMADFYDQDPSVSALLTMRGGGIFHLCHIDCRKFHVFELDLTFEKKRIRIRELGTIIEEYSVGDNRVFRGISDLEQGCRVCRRSTPKRCITRLPISATIWTGTSRWYARWRNRLRRLRPAREFRGDVHE